MYSIDLATRGTLPTHLLALSTYLCLGGLIWMTSNQTPPPRISQQLTSSYPISDDQDQDDIPNWDDFDDDNDGIPDSVECGYIAIDPFLNGGFEEPGNISSYKFFSQDDVPGWNTTASDGKIELWAYTGSSHFVVPPYEGNHFAELNATEVSTLYQEMSFNGAGGTLAWSVVHRGRSGTDVAHVNIGPSLDSAVTQETMSDGKTAWGYYSGTYVVDPGITSLTFAFEAVSAAGGSSVGNFIDDIVITLTQDCLDSDGDGLINSLDLDSDGDGIPDIIEAGGTDANGDGMVDYPTPGDPMTMVDTDDDGLADDYDDVDSGSGAGEYTSGTSLSSPNTDDTGSGDFMDIDADDDGIVDNTESQGSFIYVSPSGSDTDSDGLDDAYDPDCQPCGGITGISIIPIDSDNDGIPDFQDTDSDSDGFPDSLEGHDTNGDGTVNGSDSPSANTGSPGGDTDADGDGLLDGYDNDPADFDATNGSLTAASHPDFHGVTSERDWREQFVLEVEWRHLEVQQIGSRIQLSWALNSHRGIDHFVIERSVDGLQFDAIGTIKQPDRKHMSHRFTYEDRGIPSEEGVSLLYRIRLIDVNGREQTSDLLEWVTTDSDPPFTLNAFSNPDREVLTILLTYKGAATVTIFSTTGEIVFSRGLSPGTSSKEIQIPVGDWAAGVYSVTVHGNSTHISQQIRLIR